MYKYENLNKEPLILDPEDWSEAEYKTLCKLFGCPESTTQIKVNYQSIEASNEKEIL